MPIFEQNLSFDSKIMKLVPIRDNGNFDYFRVLLSQKVPIYNRDGEVVTWDELFHTPFGHVVRNFDTGNYCIYIEDK